MYVLVRLDAWVKLRLKVAMDATYTQPLTLLRHAKYIDTYDYITFLNNTYSQLENILSEWNYIYGYYNCEICSIQRKYYLEKFGIDIESATTTDLNVIPYYLCCINIRHKESNCMIHICSFLPCIIGSNLDKSVRSKVPDTIAARDDVFRNGLAYLKSSFYHFFSTINTNTKLSHLFQESAKYRDIEARHYIYDSNWRGHMFHMMQEKHLGHIVSILKLRDCQGNEHDLVSRKCTRCLNKTEKYLVDIAEIYCTCALKDIDIEFEGYIDDLANRIKHDEIANQADDTILFSKFEIYINLLMNTYDENLTRQYLNSNPQSNLLNANIIYKQNLLRILKNTFLHFHHTLLKRDNIDDIKNKCVNDGPIIYGLFLSQFNLNIQSTSLSNLKTHDTYTAIETWRNHSVSANLGMIISRNANIQIKVNQKKQLNETIMEEKKKIATNYNLSTNPNSLSQVNHFSNTTNSRSNTNVINSCGSSVATNLSSATNGFKNSIIDINYDDVKNKIRNKKSKVKDSYFTFDAQNNILHLGILNGAIIIHQRNSIDNRYNMLFPVVPDRTVCTETIFNQVRKLNSKNNVSIEFKKMTRQSDGYISYYNAGNIKSAGLFMNLTYFTRKTLFLKDRNDFIYMYFKVMAYVYNWLVNGMSFNFQNLDLTLNFNFNSKFYFCRKHNKLYCNDCLVCILTNEFFQVGSDLLYIEKSFIPQFIICSKLLFPSVCILYDQGDIFLKIMINYGILLLPFTIIDYDLDQTNTTVSQYQSISLPSDYETPKNTYYWCKNCKLYTMHNICDIMNQSTQWFQLDRFKYHKFLKLRKFLYSNSQLYDYFIDGNVSLCERHIWVAPFELAFFKHNRKFKYLESCCFNVITTAAFNEVTKISYTKVAINGAKRCLVINNPDSKFNKFMSYTLEQSKRFSLNLNQIFDTFQQYYEKNLISDLKLNNYIDVLSESKYYKLFSPSIDSSKIYALVDNNTFLMNFMFGDFGGYNTEDAYVINQDYIIDSDYVVQPKFSFNTVNSSFKIPKIGSYRFIDATDFINLEPCGGLFLFGIIVSDSEFHFNTNSNIIVNSTHSNTLYIYHIYYMNNMPFIDHNFKYDAKAKKINVEYDYMFIPELTFNKNGNLDYIRSLLGLRKKIDIKTLYSRQGVKDSDYSESEDSDDEEFNDEYNKVSNTKVLNSKHNKKTVLVNKFKQKTKIKKMNLKSKKKTPVKKIDDITCNLYKASTDCGRFTKEVYVNSKYVRIKLTIKNIKILNKITTNNGRKGIPIQCDMRHLKTLRGHDIHVITSYYSMLNRGSLSQIFEQLSFGGLAKSLSDFEPVYDNRTNIQVGWCGRGLFRFSTDNPVENIQNHHMRCDNLTDITFLNNQLSSTLHNITSNTENGITTAFGLMSDMMFRVFGNYNRFNRLVIFKRFIAKMMRIMLNTYFFLVINGCESVEFPRILLNVANELDDENLS